ncbi:MAG TPA: 1,4-alpha-glucan branching enzyme, partial [Methylibium sp.]
MTGAISEADVEALLGARHADPFGVLGLHAAEDGRLWLRALLPGARAVWAVDAPSGQRLAPLAVRHPDGLFEGLIPRRRKHFDYRLDVLWDDGREERLADAYAYGTQLAEADLQALRAGEHLRPYTVLGAHPLRHNGVAGVRFAVWAPNASRVSVVGDFNRWDGRRHAMRLRHEAGVWEIFVPGAALGHLYKFELLDAAGQLLPLKADPYARAAQLRPETASRVAGLPPVRALSPQRGLANVRSAA